MNLASWADKERGITAAEKLRTSLSNVKQFIAEQRR
jgi:hypothetical protein